MKAAMRELGCNKSAGNVAPGGVARVPQQPCVISSAQAIADIHPRCPCLLANLSSSSRKSSPILASPKMAKGATCDGLAGKSKGDPSESTAELYFKH
jgi:hypothetical protein